MPYVFLVLLLVTIVGLVWGLVSPRHLASKLHIGRLITRKHTGFGFSALALVFFVLIGVTAPKVPAKNAAVQKAQISQTSTITVPKAQAKAPEKPVATPPVGSQVAAAGPQVTPAPTPAAPTASADTKTTTLVASTPAPKPVVTPVAPAAAPTPPAAVTPAPAPASAPTPAPTAAATPTGCYPRSNAGNCYKAGQLCRATDHGVSGTDVNGTSITCKNVDGWRWDY